MLFGNVLEKDIIFAQFPKKCRKEVLDVFLLVTFAPSYGRCLLRNEIRVTRYESGIDLVVPLATIKA